MKKPVIPIAPGGRHQAAQAPGAQGPPESNRRRWPRSRHWWRGPGGTTCSSNTCTGSTTVIGQLGAPHLAALAQLMGLAQTEVYEVATFYHHFDVVKENPDGSIPAPPAP